MSVSNEFDEQLNHGIVASQAYTEMREQRDTLITALRECVVALDTALMLSDVPEHCQDDEWYEKRRCLDGSLSSGKSTLERYGEK